MTPKTMNKLVEAKFRTQKGNLIKLYNRNGITGVWSEGHSITYPVDIEYFTSALKKTGRFQLLEMTRQVRERELGNADIAYEVTKWANGKVVSHTNG